MPTPITISVRNCAPVPKGDSQQLIPWRQRVADATRDALPEKLGPLETVDRQFSVTMDFFVSLPLIDLDNLAKPILDTLFAPGPPNPNRDHLADITGVGFTDGDERIGELCLRKTLEPDPLLQGVKITVSWTDVTA
jgi:hypothetical protein